jgi:hypothetical protein
MCYSAEASIGSFMISFIGFLFLYNRNHKNDRLFATIIFGISTMQIGEYLIHRDLNCIRHGLNKLGSAIGLLSHSIIQPLFSFFAVLLFSRFKLSNNIKILWIILIVLNMIWSFYYWPKPQDLCSYSYECQNKKLGCQLYWPWYSSVNVPLYALLVFIMPILFSDLANKLLWLVYVGIGPGMLTILYPKTSNSVWCFLGPALTILIKIFIDA